MKVYLGNNLGYRLQLISANQKKRHSRRVGHRFQRAKMSHVFSHYPFLKKIMGFKETFKAIFHPASLYITRNLPDVTILAKGHFHCSWDARQIWKVLFSLPACC